MGFEVIGQPILDFIVPFLFFLGVVLFVVMAIMEMVPLPKIIKNEVSSFVVVMTGLGAVGYYFTNYI